MKEKEVHLRVSMDLWKYLGELPDKTDYITKLIDRDRLDRLDHKVIDGKIREHQEAIKELQGLKKTKPINEDKIQDCFKYWHDVSKNQIFRDDQDLEKYCEKRILPNVKKLGYKGSAKDLADILLNWPEEGN